MGRYRLLYHPFVVGHDIPRLDQSVRRRIRAAIEAKLTDHPEATAKPLDSEKEHLVITIDNNQLVYINDFKIDVESLGEKLNKMLQGRSDREVYLKADKKIPYGIVVQVMAEIKNAGIEQLGMITEPADPKKRSDTQNAKS